MSGVLRDGVDSEDGMKRLTAEWFTEVLNGDTTLEKWEWLGFASKDEYRDHCYTIKYWDHHPPRIDAGIDPEVAEAAKDLWYAANHFARVNESSYSRTVGLPRRIMYDSDWFILKSRLSAVCHAVEDVVRDVRNDYQDWEREVLDVPKKRSFVKCVKRIPWRFKISYGVHVDMDRHLPDGTLDNGSVITFWEETGEYFDMVQEHVGGLVAEFLLDQPENPHAKRIAEALMKTNDRTRIDVREAEYVEESPRFYWNRPSTLRKVLEVADKLPEPVNKVVKRIVPQQVVRRRSSGKK